MQFLERILNWGGTRRDIAFLVVSGLALLSSMFHLLPLSFDAAWIAVILCGIPIVLEAVVGLVTALDIKADVLVSMALLASLAIGENFAAGEVAFIMQLGALLEDLTVAKARSGIEKLIHLTPRTARKVEGKSETVIPAQQVHVGDVLRVLPGETVPVDGVILCGQTSINQAVMTGESLPVDKGPGDSVSSGTVNQFGSFDMTAVRVGEDSSIQRMIRLVQSTDAGKAKIVGIADRWATWIVAIALAAAILTGIVTQEPIRAVTILVVFCPCALVLATPTAIMAAIGNATKYGFLVREGDALERLATVSCIAFDKTGTLTRGDLQVTAVKSFHPHMSDSMLYTQAACAEQRSEHPLGKAVVRCHGEEVGISLPPADAFRMLPGRGVEAKTRTHVILVGSQTLFEESGIAILPQAKTAMEQYLHDGCTLILVAIDGSFCGFLALSDTLRADARETIAEIKRTGVVPILLTGDQENAARHMASLLNIREVHSGCLPEDKLRLMDAYQNHSQNVCMIGDGINDAPALKKAHVGIAMGGIGSDIAVDAADIVLVNDEICRLPHLLLLARRMMFTIRCNLTFSMALNFVAIILAITGVLNPVVGALVHNAGSVLVIVNSAFLLFRSAS